MRWNAELAYFVTPKSGPMRPMMTLRDVNHALLDDLPIRHRYRQHWYIVGRLLLAAASEASSRLILMVATDAVVTALEVEGWMTWQPIVGRELAAPLPDDNLFQLPLALAA